MQKSLILAATATLALSTATPVLGRAMTETDLATLKRLSAPSASPDGSMIAYQLRETDMEGNKGRTDLYMLKLGDPAAQPVKFASKVDKESSKTDVLKTLAIGASLTGVTLTETVAVLVKPNKSVNV